MSTYSVPFGKTALEFDLPAGISANVAVSRPVEPVADEMGEIHRALQQPAGCSPLRALARPGQRACIVFTDITRASPDHLLVPALIHELEAGGVRDGDITLLCGVGMHRPSTPAEKTAKLGEDTARRFRVLDSEPQNPQALVDLGVTEGGVPVSIHRAAVESDLLIATGIVEPHQYAGYSGGGKTVAVGAAGEALIAHTHGPAFAEHPATRLGRIEGNPFQEAVTEAARRANLRFVLNVVLGGDQRILRAAAGDFQAAFRELVAFARTVYEVAIPQQYDLAVAGTGYPKDSNLYQASRAATYLFFAPTPVVRPGGYLILPAPCPEGAGEGVGEGRFFQAMKTAPHIRAILEDARRNGYPPGQQRAFILAKVLEQARVIVVGSQRPDIVADCKMIPAETMADAFGLIQADLGPCLEALIVPHALQTLPVVRPECDHLIPRD